ncbi:MAG: hypothetical protein ACN2B6_07425 [Rickettsiales bacterium]
MADITFNDVFTAVRAERYRLCGKDELPPDMEVPSDLNKKTVYKQPHNEAVHFAEAAYVANRLVEQVGMGDRTMSFMLTNTARQRYIAAIAENMRVSKGAAEGELGSHIADFELSASTIVDAVDKVIADMVPKKGQGR